MEVTPFAEVPPQREAVIALVREQLERDCAEGRCPPGEGLDRLVEGAVLELWDAPVKTFVPLLALRRAREVLMAARSAVSSEPESALARPARRASGNLGRPKAPTCPGAMP